MSACPSPGMMPSGQRSDQSTIASTLRRPACSSTSAQCSPSKAWAAIGRPRLESKKLPRTSGCAVNNHAIAPSLPCMTASKTAGEVVEAMHPRWLQSWALQVCQHTSSAGNSITKHNLTLWVIIRGCECQSEYLENVSTSSPFSEGEMDDATA